VTFVIRESLPADAPGLLQLRRAGAGLRGDLAPGTVLVAERQGSLVGGVAFERPRPEHLRVTELLVAEPIGPEDAAEIASALVEAVVARSPRTDGAVSALAGFDDLEALGVLLRGGLVGSRLLEAGGRSVLYLRDGSDLRSLEPRDHVLVAVEPVRQLQDLVNDGSYTVVDAFSHRGEPVVEVVRFHEEERATLKSGEVAAGISFSGAMLAAMTFLLGFSFASGRFPDSVRVLLIGSTGVTTLSLIIYASASGELARLKKGSFQLVMKWGNVLSEYGGVFPFIISLPITYSQLAGTPWSAVLLAVVLSAGLLIYEATQFSIAVRFPRTRVTWLLSAVIDTSPLSGTLASHSTAASWIWTIAVTLALSAQTWIYLFLRGEEGDAALPGRRFRRSLRGAQSSR
jgi:hypothetical protein